MAYESHPLSFFLFILIAFVSLVQTASAETPPSYFTVTKGESVFQVARNLKKDGYIESRIGFVVPLLWSGDYKKIKTGQYALSTQLAKYEIVSILKEGNTAAVRIDITPGMTINDISRLLSKANLPQAEDFLKVTLPGGTHTLENSFLAGKPSTAGLEGYLYPDSYQIESTETAQEIVGRLLDNFEKHLPEISQSTSTASIYETKNLHDIVIMASILEKEVRTLEDKKKVAGILWKRMEHNLPLQVDSTAGYFYAKKSGISYNTYDHTGLPFGPISNPSLESLIAASQPALTDYWYYLSSRDGTTVFSRTLGEHLINKAKFVE